MGSKPGEPPCWNLTRVEFGVLSNEDIVRQSVLEVERPKDLYSPSLGELKHGDRCATCSADNTCFKDQRSCDGHSGHIRLPFPVYHPFLLRELVEVLKRICFHCFEIKERRKKGRRCKLIKITKKNENISTVTNGETLQKLDDTISTEENPLILTSDDEDSPANIKKSGIKKMGAKLPHRVIPKRKCAVAKDGFPAKASKKHRKDDISIARRNLQENNNARDSGDINAIDGCQYCKAGSKYPEPKLTVVTKKLGREIAKIIQMEVDEEANLPDDYWEGLKTLKCNDHRKYWTSRILLPLEAWEILKKSTDVAEIITQSRNILELDDYFVKNIYVSPNCMRFVSDIGNVLSIQKDKLTSRLSSLLTKCKSLAVGNISEDDILEVQRLVLSYFTATKLTKEADKSKNTTNQSLKPRDHTGVKWFRKTIVGKVNNFSARCVLVGDPSLRLDEIGVPNAVASNLTVKENATSFNIKKLQHIKNGAYDSKRGGVQIVKLFRKGEDITSKHCRILEIGDIVHRSLANGDHIFLNRMPTIHKHSLVAFKVKRIPGCTIALNPIVCHPYNADFDGDEVNLCVPQSEESRAELIEMMTIPKQLISSQAGQPIISLSQDSLLAAHLLTSRHVFLNKKEMCQLAMYSRSTSFCEPAIVKAPLLEGPLWTGKQLFSTTLPRNIRYEKDNLIIRDGELLLCGDDSSWLKCSSGGYISRLYELSGPDVTMQHLDSSQKVLTAWLSDVGFSLGIFDFLLTKDSYTRKKMLAEVQGCLQEAKCKSVTRHFLSNQAFQTDIEFRKSISKMKDKEEQLVQSLAAEFQTVFYGLEMAILPYIPYNNPLLTMVKAGSKGSMEKIVRQGACIGLQLGERSNRLFLPKFNTSRTTLLERLEDNVIDRSFVDGLRPKDLFISAMSSSKSSAKISEPGSLFRYLMVYLRDIHIAYDGTVRNGLGNHILQFNYGTEDLDDEAWKEHAGEPVGALAATALAEPLYNLVTNGTSSSGSNSPQPLEVIKTTLWRRKKAELKTLDNCVELRLSKSSLKGPHAQEWVAAKIKSYFQSLTIEMLASESIIEYKPASKGASSWVGHIHFWKEALRSSFIHLGDVRQILQKQYPSFLFNLSENCQLCWPCVQFRLKTTSAQEDSFELVKNAFLYLLKTIISGNDCIQSAEICWEEKRYAPQYIAAGIPRDGELMLRVHVKNYKKRGVAWNVVKMACLPILDALDFERTLPCSVQEIRENLGIEAAKTCIFEVIRKLIPLNDKHAMLIATALTHTGDVNALVFSGYKDFLESMSMHAPFQKAALFAPGKSFQLAALENEGDDLLGALACSTWGKRVSLGTGANFELLWQNKGKSVQKFSYNSDIKNLLSIGVKRKVPVGVRKRNNGCLSRHISIPESDMEHARRLGWQMSKMLHKKGYSLGDALDEADQKLVLEQILPYHPDRLAKIGCGVRSIKIDSHPEHSDSRCFFIVRNDATETDFSYHKCLAALEKVPATKEVTKDVNILSLVEI